MPVPSAYPALFRGKFHRVNGLGQPKEISSALPGFGGHLLDCLATAAFLEGQLEHGVDLTASRRLCDKGGGSQEEDDDGQGQAASRDGIANKEVHILLDEGNHQQRDHSPNINAPVEPVEETSGGIPATVRHLQIFKSTGE